MENIVKKEMIKTIISYKKNIGIVIDTKVTSSKGILLRCDADSVDDWNRSFVEDLYVQALSSKVDRDHRIEIYYSHPMYTINIQKRFTKIDSEGITDMWSATTLWGNGRNLEDTVLTLLRNSVCYASKEATPTYDAKQKKEKYKVLS